MGIAAIESEHREDTIAVEPHSWDGSAWETRLCSCGGVRKVLVADNREMRSETIRPHAA